MPLNPDPSPGRHATRAESRSDGPDFDGEVKDACRQIRSLLMKLNRVRSWPSEKVDDALSEIVTRLQSELGSRVWHDFHQANFGTHGYEIAKRAVFRTIDLVMDRMRERHKVEVKPGSVYYNEEKSGSVRGLRQRRDLGPEQSLGEADRYVEDTPPFKQDADARLDINDACVSLTETQRIVVARRIFDSESWVEIATALQLPEYRVRRTYDEAIALLGTRLRSYQRDPG